jgi:hypothetical protein
MMPFVIVGRSQNVATLLLICADCGEPQRIRVTREQAEELGTPNRRKIQEVLPDIPRDQREMFITGICGKCWIKLFGPRPENPSNP